MTCAICDSSGPLTTLRAEYPAGQTGVRRSVWRAEICEACLVAIAKRIDPTFVETQAGVEVPA